jgi:hypothetical protein
MAMNPMLVMVMVVVLPMVMMMVLPMTVVIVMMVRLPVDVVHLGCQFAGVALSNGDARADRSRRLRLLRWSRDNQKRADSRKSQKFLQNHNDLRE